MKKEDVKISDFKIKSMPELSSEGAERNRVIKPKGIKHSFGEDELNENKIKFVIKFKMEKGSYATFLIDKVLE